LEAIIITVMVLEMKAPTSEARSQKSEGGMVQQLTP